MIVVEPETKPSGPDVDHGYRVFVGCWVLTAVVALVLSLRFAVKIWMSSSLPRTSRPERIWGWDDVAYVIGFGLDLVQMCLVWKAWYLGLGRHIYYIPIVSRMQAIKWYVIAQLFAIAATTISRAGVVIFLYNTLGSTNKRLRYIILGCAIIPVIVALASIIQILTGCGLKSSPLVNRFNYFQYTWQPLPKDGSVVCQAQVFRMLIGFVRGLVNSIIDFTLVVLSAIEIWQALFQALGNGNGLSALRRFREIDPRVRNQRVWQTVLLCVPLFISGIASIFRVYLFSQLSIRSDLTWDAVPFILWSKIEGYSIPISTCGPILRLLTRRVNNRQQMCDLQYDESSDFSNSSEPHVELEHETESATHEFKVQNTTVSEPVSSQTHEIVR